MSRRSLALSVLSGLLLAFSFPAFEFSVLVWFALVPLLLALTGQSVRNGFLLAGSTGLVFFCGTIFWISHALTAHGPFSPLPAGLMTMLLCLFLSLFIASFGAMAVRIRELRPGLFVLIAPASWVVLELGRTYLLTGFPWLLLGYSQYRVLPLIQIADITGVYGLSFLIVLVNTAIFLLIEDRRRLLPPLIALAAAGAVLAYGMHRLDRPEGPGTFRVSVIQGNIEQDRKWDPAYQRSVINTYERLTRLALRNRPDLVIWPETALPFYFGSKEPPSPAFSEDLKRFVRSSGIEMIVGSALHEVRDHRQVLRNAAVFLDGEGGVDDNYAKHHLVPFGEYVPLKNGPLFFMDKLVQPAGVFEPGREYTVVGIRSAATGRNVPVSTVICYEIIFPGHVRRFVNDGTTVITTITNDAWFGRTAAPSQHFAMAVLRAVENRVPVARAANTGISGFIDAKGRILAASDIFTEAALTCELAPRTGPKTFYTRYGDVFAWLCVLATIVIVLPTQPQPAPRLGIGQDG